MRAYRVGVDLTQTKGVLLGREGDTDTQGRCPVMQNTCGSEGHQDRQESPEAGKGQGRTLLCSLPTEHGIAETFLWDFGKTITSCCFKPPVCGSSLHTPQKRTHTPTAMCCFLKSWDYINKQNTCPRPCLLVEGDTHTHTK